MIYRDHDVAAGGEIVPSHAICRALPPVPCESAISGNLSNAGARTVHLSRRDLHRTAGRPRWSDELVLFLGAVFGGIPDDAV